jgi:hypothetical protein
VQRTAGRNHAPEAEYQKKFLFLTSWATAAGVRSPASHGW